MRERMRTASGVAAQPYSGTLPGLVHLEDGSAMPILRAPVTGNWFDVLGVRARAGRLLNPDDDRVGVAHVLVLSSAFAERLFGRAGDALGQRIRLQEATFTVVGVAPAEFDYPKATQVWMPAVWSKDSPFVAWDLIVRVAPGFSTSQASAEMASALRTLSKQTGPLGDIDENQIIHAQSFANHIVGDVRPALLMLAGGVALMLIVAGVNVANLLIARGLARRRELCVRTAVGASRGRLLRQLATEAIVLAAAGAVLAVVVAWLALDLLLVLAPAELPRRGEIGIDVRALAFTAVVGMTCALLFGILPSLHSARVEPAQALRAPDDNATPGARSFWLRHGLVIGQIAVTSLVLSTAGLLLRSFERLQQLDLGFASQNVFLAELRMPPSRSAEPADTPQAMMRLAADTQQAMMRLAEHTATLPGVSGATAVCSEPFAGTSGVDATIVAEGQAFDAASSPIVNYEGVDGSYFATLGLPVLRGRGIDGRDRARSAPVVVVNENFARTFWPGQDPLGRRLTWNDDAPKSQWYTVVGLVADTRYRDLTAVRPSIYIPYEQGIPVSPGYLAVRGNSPSAVAGAIRRAVTDLEPGTAVVSIAPLVRLLAAPLARPRFQTTLVGAFAGLALALSIVGTYGTLSFVVRQRRREIGIRMALGAAASNVRRLVLLQGLAIGLLGVGLGLVSAVAAGRLIQPLLFDVTATDPLVLVGTATALLAAVFFATLLPTRSATRTDPLLVLRSQ